MVDHEQFYDTYLQTAIHCARSAGEIISAAFSKPKSVILKGAVDLVSVGQQSHTCPHTLSNAVQALS